MAGHRERDERVIDDRLEIALAAYELMNPDPPNRLTRLPRIGVERDHQHRAIVEARAADAWSTSALAFSRFCASLMSGASWV